MEPPAIRHDTVRLEDITLHYRTWGSGPPLYLIHGGPGGSGSYWVEGAPYLGDRHTVYALDLRGHGLSGRRPPYTIARLAEDVQGFARALGHDAYDLLGHSLGALVGMRAAGCDPHVRSLILVGGFPFAAGMMVHPSGLPTKLKLGLRLARWNVDLRLGRSPPMEDLLHRLLREARPLLQADDADVDHIEHILGESIVPPLDPVLPLQLDLLHWDHRDALRGIRVPTLVLVGDEDTLAGPLARDLARKIPRAHLVRIPRAGHAPFFDRPEQFQEAVERFLSRVAPNHIIPMSAGS